jgi:hypothetical protein
MDALIVTLVKGRIKQILSFAALTIISVLPSTALHGDYFSNEAGCHSIASETALTMLRVEWFELLSPIVDSSHRLGNKELKQNAHTK